MFGVRAAPLPLVSRARNDGAVSATKPPEATTPEEQVERMRDPLPSLLLPSLPSQQQKALASMLRIRAAAASAAASSRLLLPAVAGAPGEPLAPASVVAPGQGPASADATNLRRRSAAATSSATKRHVASKGSHLAAGKRRLLGVCGVPAPRTSERSDARTADSPVLRGGGNDVSGGPTPSRDGPLWRIEEPSSPSRSLSTDPSETDSSVDDNAAASTADAFVALAATGDVARRLSLAEVRGAVASRARTPLFDMHDVVDTCLVQRRHRHREARQRARLPGRGLAAVAATIAAASGGGNDRATRRAASSLSHAVAAADGCGARSSRRACSSLGRALRKEDAIDSVGTDDDDDDDYDDDEDDYFGYLSGGSGRSDGSGEGEEEANISVFTACQTPAPLLQPRRCGKRQRGGRISELAEGLPRLHFSWGDAVHTVAGRPAPPSHVVAWHQLRRRLFAGAVAPASSSNGNPAASCQGKCSATKSSERHNADYFLRQSAATPALLPLVGNQVSATAAPGAAPPGVLGPVVIVGKSVSGAPVTAVDPLARSQRNDDLAGASPAAVSVLLALGSPSLPSSPHLLQARGFGTSPVIKAIPSPAPLTAPTPLAEAIQPGSDANAAAGRRSPSRLDPKATTATLLSNTAVLEAASLRRPSLDPLAVAEGLHITSPVRSEAPSASASPPVTPWRALSPLLERKAAGASSPSHAVTKKGSNATPTTPVVRPAEPPRLSSRALATLRPAASPQRGGGTQGKPPRSAPAAAVAAATATETAAAAVSTAPTTSDEAAVVAATVMTAAAPPLGPSLAGDDATQAGLTIPSATSTKAHRDVMEGRMRLVPVGQTRPNDAVTTEASFGMSITGMGDSLGANAMAIIVTAPKRRRASLATSEATVATAATLDGVRHVGGSSRNVGKLTEASRQEALRRLAETAASASAVPLSVSASTDQTGGEGDNIVVQSPSRRRAQIQAAAATAATAMPGASTTASTSGVPSARSRATTRSSSPTARRNSNNNNNNARSGGKAPLPPKSPNVATAQPVVNSNNVVSTSTNINPSLNLSVAGAPGGGKKDRRGSTSSAASESETETPMPIPEGPQYTGATIADIVVRTRLQAGCPLMPELPTLSPATGALDDRTSRMMNPVRLCAVVAALTSFVDTKIAPPPAQARADAAAVAQLLTVLGYRVTTLLGEAEPAAGASLDDPGQLSENVATKTTIVAAVRAAVADAGAPATYLDGTPVARDPGEAKPPLGVCLVYLVGVGAEGHLHGYEEKVHYLMHRDTKLGAVSRHNTLVIEDLTTIRHASSGLQPLVIAEILPIRAPLKGVEPNRVGQRMAVVRAGQREFGSELTVHYPPFVNGSAATWYAMKGIQGDAVRSGRLTPPMLNAYIKDSLHAQFMRIIGAEMRDVDSKSAPSAIRSVVDACFVTEAANWIRPTSESPNQIVGRDRGLFHYRAELSEQKDATITTACRFQVDVLVDVRYLGNVEGFLRQLQAHVNRLFYPKGKYYSAKKFRRLQLLHLYRTGEYRVELDPLAVGANMPVVIGEGSCDDDISELTGLSCETRRGQLCPVTYRLRTSDTVLVVKTATPNPNQDLISKEIYNRFYIQNFNKIADYRITGVREKIHLVYSGCERDFLEFVKHGALGSFCFKQLYSCSVEMVHYQQLTPPYRFVEGRRVDLIPTSSLFTAGGRQRKSTNQESGSGPLTPIRAGGGGGSARGTRNNSFVGASGSTSSPQMPGGSFSKMSFVVEALTSRLSGEAMFRLIAKVQARFRARRQRPALLARMNFVRAALTVQRTTAVGVPEEKARKALKQDEMRERRFVLEVISDRKVHELREYEGDCFGDIVLLCKRWLTVEHAPAVHVRVLKEEELAFLSIREGLYRGEIAVRAFNLMRVLLGSVKILPLEADKRNRLTNIETSDRGKIKTMMQQAYLPLSRNVSNAGSRRRSEAPPA